MEAPAGSCPRVSGELTKGGPAEASIRQSVLGASCWNGGENNRRSVRAKKLGCDAGSKAGQRRLTSRCLVGRIAYSPSIRIEAHIACDHFMLSSWRCLPIGRMVGDMVGRPFPRQGRQEIFFPLSKRALSRLWGER